MPTGECEIRAEVNLKVRTSWCGLCSETPRSAPEMQVSTRAHQRGVCPASIVSMFRDHRLWAPPNRWFSLFWQKSQVLTEYHKDFHFSMSRNANCGTNFLHHSESRVSYSWEKPNVPRLQLQREWVEAKFENFRRERQDWGYDSNPELTLKIYH